LADLLSSLNPKQYHDSKQWDDKNETSKDGNLNMKDIENLDNLKIKPFSIVKVNPSPDYIIHSDDVLYGFGRIDQ